jgi:hypothetical protein
METAADTQESQVFLLAFFALLARLAMSLPRPIRYRTGLPDRGGVGRRVSIGCFTAKNATSATGDKGVGPIDESTRYDQRPAQPRCDIRKTGQEIRNRAFA